MPTPDQIEILIFKSITGTLKEEEQKILKDWEDAGDENRLLMAELSDKRKLKEIIKEFYDFRDGAIEQDHDNGLDMASQPAGSRGTWVYNWKKYRIHVAAFLFIALVSIVLYYSLKPGINENRLLVNIPPTYDSLVTGANEVKTIILPDESRVNLNVASVLYYPKAYADDLRRVYLKGEAYFEVASNKDRRPFIVQTAGQHPVEIRVLSTKFNVNAYERAARTITAVVKGQVSVKNDNNKITISEGKEALPDGTGKLYARPTNTAQVLHWVDSIELKNVADILEMLGAWHNLKIVYKTPSVETAAADYSWVTVIRRRDGVEVVLKTLRLIGFEFETRDQQLIVKRKSD